MSDQGYRGFADFWSKGDWSPFVRQLHIGNRTKQSIAVLQQPAGKFPDPSFDEFLIQLVIRGNYRAEVAYGSEKFAMRGSPGTLVVAPPNVECDYEIDARHTVAALAINKSALRRFSEQSEVNAPADFGVLHSHSFFDPIIEALMLRMLEHASGDHPASDLFLDDATNTILSSLFHRSSAAKKGSSLAKPLSVDEVAKVSRLIDDRIEDSLNIADLARETSLSDWHFARAFKAATGLSPHQFVLRRKIARAKDLLGKRKLPLAEVAVASGFSSQSHMSDVFREKVGVTPGKYRREVAG